MRMTRYWLRSRSRRRQRLRQWQMRGFMLDGNEVVDSFTSGALEEVRSGTIEIER
jgi:hypothetical protein